MSRSPGFERGPRHWPPARISLESLRHWPQPLTYAVFSQTRKRSLSRLLALAVFLGCGRRLLRWRLNRLGRSLLTLLPLLEQLVAQLFAHELVVLGVALVHLFLGFLVLENLLDHLLLALPVL